MMHKKIIFTAALFLLAITLKSTAQPYKTGIGIRLGGISSGITVKHFIGSNSAIEGIASFGRHSFLITGLYEKHQAFPKAEGLSWFYGFGAHVGFFNNDYGYHYFYYKSHGDKIHIDEFYDNRVSFGGDLIIGIEYKFKDAPVDIGLDIKPFVDLVPGVYGYWEGAFSFRFTL
jgi:hypothetical protein